MSKKLNDFEFVDLLQKIDLIDAEIASLKNKRKGR